jgi:hypothetical protein
LKNITADQNSQLREYLTKCHSIFGTNQLEMSETNNNNKARIKALKALCADSLSDLNSQLSKVTIWPEPKRQEEPEIVTLKTLGPEERDVLNKWIKSHEDNPYPTTQEKNDLCYVTGLSLTQVNNCKH